MESIAIMGCIRMTVGRVCLVLFLIGVCQCVALSATWADDTPLKENRKIGGWPTEMDGRYPVGMPPGDGWNVISGDGQKFSSACIGDLRSPQCLVDTMMACGAWSNVEADWPTEFDAQLFFNHPICRALMNYPKVPTLGLQSFVYYESDPQIIVYYKLDQRRVKRSTLIDPDLPPHLWGDILIWGESLGGLQINDIAIIPFIIACTPDVTRVSGYDSNNTPIYPADTPLADCWDGTSTLKVLFARKYPDRDEWYAGYYFNVAHQGSGGKPWPMLDDWYAQAYKTILPGMKPRF
jgi:hypothetical protein